MADENQDFERQLQEANAQMYAHSQDLATRNKTLSLLRQLYQISISTFDPRILAEQIVDTIRETLEFELVGIMVYDRPSDTLKPLRFSESERLKKIAASNEVLLDSVVIPHASSINFFTTLLAGSISRRDSIDLAEIWGTVAPETVITALKESGHIKALSGYSLIIDGAVLGVLILALNRPVDALSQFEQESIDSLVDVVAIALDRAHLYQELQTSNDQQVILIHFITHQIKGFVAKSRNIFASVLEGDYGTVPETMKPMLQAGFESDTKGAQTIQEILNASNIKSGKVSYTMAPFDLKELIESITKDLKPAADAKALALNLNLGSQPFMINGDIGQLTNVFKNLIDNSVKYTQKGHVNVSLDKDGAMARFKIEDTGVGITPEDMKNLFTEGGHGKDSTKVNVESTGFGLYIVKNIIDAHKGKVWAESEGAGKGSRFIVELPL